MADLTSFPIDGNRDSTYGESAYQHLNPQYILFIGCLLPLRVSTSLSVHCLSILPAISIIGELGHYDVK